MVLCWRFDGSQIPVIMGSLNCANLLHATYSPNRLGHYGYYNFQEIYSFVLCFSLIHHDTYLNLPEKYFTMKVLKSFKSFKFQFAGKKCLSQPPK